MNAVSRHAERTLSSCCSHDLDASLTRDPDTLQLPADILGWILDAAAARGIPLIAAVPHQTSPTAPVHWHTALPCELLDASSAQSIGLQRRQGCKGPFTVAAIVGPDQLLGVLLHQGVAGAPEPATWAALLLEAAVLCQRAAVDPGHVLTA